MDADSSSVANSSPPHHPSPVALSKRTSSRHVLSSRTYLDGVAEPPTTPPTTPPNQRRPRGKGKEPAHGQIRRREQLRRDEKTDTHRHSHGLSWSSTTRDSVVDNLLLSLDHMSSQQFPDVRDDEDAEFDKEKYRLPSMPQFPQLQGVQPANRVRTHTYSSSLSSGYDNYGIVVADSPSSKYSSPAKGRRSNSSSNFPISHSLQGKLNNTRRKNSASRSSSDTQRFMGNSYLMNGSNDLDNVNQGYNSVVETGRQPWASRRSVSMDHIYNEAAAQEGLSILGRGRPVPSVYSKYDAAPEPGIPAGPRKKLNPTATGPVYVNAAPTKQSIRKVNTQSDLRNASRPGTIPQYIHDQASDFVRANSIRGVPPVSALHQTAPTSTSGLRSSRKDAASPQRERPGFFKRVFGGGSRTISVADSHDSYRYLDKTAAPARTKSQASHDANTQSRQASRDHTATTSQPTPSLSKKPSSFFRRRKKSTSEALRPPPLPLNAANNINLAVRTAEPSPSVSSLRKVMYPYLSTDASGVATTGKARTDDLSRPTTGETTTDSDDLAIFHSGYTPPPDASLGMRDPLRRDVSTRGKVSHERADSSRLKVKVKKRKEGVQPILVGSPQKPRHSRDSSIPKDGHGDLNATANIVPFTLLTENPAVAPLSDAHTDHPNRKENQRPVSRASTGDLILASQGGSQADSNGERRNCSSGTADSNVLKDDDRVAMHGPNGESALRRDSHPLERLVPQPVDVGEEQSDELEMIHPADDARSASASRSASVAVPIDLQSPLIPSVYHSATSLPLPSVQVDGKDVSRNSIEHITREMPSAMVDEGVEYGERARRIFEGDEEDVTRAEAASWLGERNTLSTRTLQAYMQLFDLTGLNILSALRALCNKLLLRGETQQFDRIITALSERWCECNQNHGFKAQDVIHTIFYSIILLNTDLHLADIGGKMSKTAYVKNTLPTIRRVVADAAPNAFDDTIKPSAMASRASVPWTDSGMSAGTMGTNQTTDAPTERTSLEGQRPHTTKRLSIRPPVFRSDSDGWVSDSANNTVSNALVNQPWNGPMRGWEFEIENILKSFFNSIRSDPLPLLDSPSLDVSSSERNLTISNFVGLKRSGSVVSKAPSDATSFRSKPGLRTMTMGWQSRVNRSRPKIYPASTLGSSRTSFDDSNSAWSPAQSSMWSKNSFAKTLTSASMNSLGYHLSPTAPDFKHSIGFANALSQAIIREEGTGPGNGDAESISVPVGLLEDEALALEGAPWAKEGLVKHKHHLDAPDRKAKERNWNDCFAVLGKGKLTLFAFNTSTKSHSMGRKAMQKHHPSGRAASLSAPKVGGGDWMENAEQLDVFVLRQTIASVLPPPGYSKTRPHVWALSLPSGAVHLFQVGTPEIATEFISTANYWSARLSKEPLSGSVSNIEYGWSDQVINPALLERSESFTSPPPSIQNVNVTRHIHTSSGGGQGGRTSFQSSLRGSFDTGFGSMKARLPGDKIQIAEWHPPTQSMMASQLLEVDQFKAVSSYVSTVEAELGKHNELKHAIELAYSPRHANYNRAMTNWQRKSDYLLREIVKFRTYMDSLAAAQKAKDQFHTKKIEQDILKGNMSPMSSEKMGEERDDLAHPPKSAG